MFDNFETQLQYYSYYNYFQEKICHFETLFAWIKCKNNIKLIYNCILFKIERFY